MNAPGCSDAKPHRAQLSLGCATFSMLFYPFLGSSLRITCGSRPAADFRSPVNGADAGPVDVHIAGIGSRLAVRSRAYPQDDVMFVATGDVHVVVVRLNRPKPAGRG